MKTTTVLEVLRDDYDRAITARRRKGMSNAEAFETVIRERPGLMRALNKPRIRDDHNRAYADDKTKASWAMHAEVQRRMQQTDEDYMTAFDALAASGAFDQYHNKGATND